MTKWSFPHLEGYVQMAVEQGQYDFQYIFQYTDHLGNIRLSFVGLGHAHDALDGVVDRTTWETTSSGKAFPNAELYASHWENRIRGENGLSLRTHYGIDRGTNLGGLLGPGGTSAHFSQGHTMPTIQLQVQGTPGSSNFKVVSVPGSNTTIFLPFKY